MHSHKSTRWPRCGHLHRHSSDIYHDYRSGHSDDHWYGRCFVLSTPVRCINLQLWMSFLIIHSLQQDRRLWKPGARVQHGGSQEDHPQQQLPPTTPGRHALVQGRRHWRPALAGHDAGADYTGYMVLVQWPGNSSECFLYLHCTGMFPHFDTWIYESDVDQRASEPVNTSEHLLHFTVVIQTVCLFDCLELSFQGQELYPNIITDFGFMTILLMWLLCL